MRPEKEKIRIKMEPTGKKRANARPMTAPCAIIALFLVLKSNSSLVAEAPLLPDALVAVEVGELPLEAVPLAEVCVTNGFKEFPPLATVRSKLILPMLSCCSRPVNDCELLLMAEPLLTAHIHWVLLEVKSIAPPFPQVAQFEPIRASMSANAGPIVADEVGGGREPLTSNVGGHLAIGDARALQQGDLSLAVEIRLRFPDAGARRQGDIGSAGVGVNHEDVGVLHLVLAALAEADPLQRRRALDLEINVGLAAGCGRIGNIDLVAGAAGT